MQQKSETNAGELSGRLRAHPSVWYVAAIVALVITVVCHFERQHSTSFPGGPTWAQYIDMYDVTHSTDRDVVDDDVVLVDVACDRVAVPVKFNGVNPFLTGSVPIVDRQMLLDFLTKVHDAGTYRYVMLDVLFDNESPKTDYDEALFSLICRMPRIVIPKTSSGELADSRLLEKARYSEYDQTLLENNFVKYPAIRNGEPSLALSMYQELTGDSVTVYSEYLATSKGRLCSAYMPLHFSTWVVPKSVYSDIAESKSRPDYIPVTAETAESSKLSDTLVLKLGEVADPDYTTEMIGRKIKDKIVIIGGLRDCDIHSTYQGSVSGAIIGYNAYQSICRGEHRVSWLYMIYAFIIYYFIWVAIQCNLGIGVIYRAIVSPNRCKNNKPQEEDVEDESLKKLLAIQSANKTAVIAIFMSWFGLPFILSLFALLSYWIFGTDNFNVFWPTALFNTGYIILCAIRCCITHIKIIRLRNVGKNKPSWVQRIKSLFRKHSKQSKHSNQS